MTVVAPLSIAIAECDVNELYERPSVKNHPHPSMHM